MGVLFSVRPTYKKTKGLCTYPTNQIQKKKNNNTTPQFESRSLVDKKKPRLDWLMSNLCSPRSKGHTPCSFPSMHWANGCRSSQPPSTCAPPVSRVCPLLTWTHDATTLPGVEGAKGEAGGFKRSIFYFHSDSGAVVLLFFCWFFVLLNFLFFLFFLTFRL